jgi:hypothetical protein
MRAANTGGDILASTALWRRVYDAIEQPVGARLEHGVQSNAFADVTVLLLRTRGGIERRLERLTRRALHGVNLPAASDVTRLQQQIGELKTQLRRMEHTLTQDRAAADRDNGGTDEHSSTRGAGGPRRAGAPRRRTKPDAGPERHEVRSGS